MSKEYPPTVIFNIVGTEWNYEFLTDSIEPLIEFENNIRDGRVFPAKRHRSRPVKVKVNPIHVTKWWVI